MRKPCETGEKTRNTFNEKINENIRRGGKERGEGVRVNAYMNNKFFGDCLSCLVSNYANNGKEFVYVN